MTPYYEHAGVTIYHGDCRDVLAEMTLGAADVVVADPPFGIGFNYGTYVDDAAAYPELMRAWIAEAQRVVGDGAFFVWQGMPNADKWHMWFPPGFRLFAACKGFVQFRPQPVQHGFDPVVFWGRIDGDPNVERRDWHVQLLAPFGANRERIEHPCPRPLQQVEYIVLLASRPTQTVLDPFMGSGTTLVASKRLGRRAIGIEREEKYCEIAAKRLQQEALPLEMGA